MSVWKLLTARWGSGSGEIDDVRIDAVSSSLQTITTAHHEIHDGDHYFVFGAQDLAVNNVLDFTWQMPDSTTWIHWLWDIDSEGEMLWRVYEGATIINPLANTATPLNSNRNSNNTSVTTMRYEIQTDLTAANADTSVGGATLISSGTTGSGKKLGGVASRDSELILKQNTVYCMRAIANEAGYINYQMQWYEHANHH